MGIVDWFINDLDTKKRALTRDLLSVAYHKKAIEMTQNTLGNSHYSLVTFYKNLGMDYGYDDNYELECEQYYKALEILERNPIYSKNEINSINTLLEKAKSYLTHD